MKHLRKRLCVLLFLLGCYASLCNASNIQVERNVQINVKSGNLKTVFSQLQNQTGLSFIFNDEMISDLKSINIEHRSIDLNKLLDSLFSDTGYTYEINNDFVYIKRQEKRIEREYSQFKGVVKDKLGLPLPGVSVRLKNTSIGVSTDIDGKFTLSIPSTDKVILIFSFIGMKDQEINLYEENENISVILEEELQELEEVIATGYFMRDKKSFTGSATVISKEDIRKIGGFSILESLSAYDPSFKISENNLRGSDPNGKLDIRIRGNSGLGIVDASATRGNPNLPTFILDGYEVAVEKVQDLDLNRIENVTLLKDAAAAAIYGSRAANGVVVIKTIAPKDGQLRVNYNFDGTVSWPDLSDYDLLNPSEKLELEKAAGLYSTRAADYNTQIILDKQYNKKKEYIERGVYTDWLVQPLNTTTFSQKHSLYLEGGYNSLRMGLDAKFETIKGLMKDSDRNRYSIGTNIMYNKNDKVLFRNYLSIDYVKGKNTPYGSFSEYVKMNPYLPIYDDNGNLNKKIDKFEFSAVLNPLYNATLNNVDEEMYIDLSNNFDFEVWVFPSLKFKAQVTVNGHIDQKDVFLSPNSTRYDKDYRFEEEIIKGYYTQDHSKSWGYTANSILSYNLSRNNHFINASLGINLVESNYDRTSFEAEGFPNEDVAHISYAKRYAKEKSPNGGEEKNRLFGGFFSMNYTYNNKYLLDLSYRLDGSSQFGANKRVAPFGSVGIGWNIHNEKFLKSISFIDQFKIRATTGTIGKVNFAPYQSMTSYTYNMDKWYSSVVSAQLMGYGNDDLKWEKTRTFDVGSDMSFYKGLFSISVSYYSKITDNLLTDMSCPPSLGFSSYKSNLGKVENKGWEFSLRGYVIRKQDYAWNIFLNGVSNKNIIKEISNSLKERNKLIDQVQSYDHNATSPFLRYEEGGSVTSIYAMNSLGIDPATGKEIFLNKKGETTYKWEPSQQIVVGNSESKLEGYIGTNIDIKNWNLYASFNYRLGGQTFNQTLIDRVENANPKENNDRRVFDQRWRQPGDITKYKDIADKSLTKASSRFVQDYNYLSLSTLTLSYKFNQDLVKKMHLENLRFLCTMSDIFRVATVKQERGIDYPFARNIKMSMILSF